MSEAFGKGYADQYDLLYRDKNYEAECDLIEEVFRRYGSGPIKRILDFGCGTGNHAIPLVKRGYEVTGVDRAPGMITHAQAKVNTMLSVPCPTPRFLEGDVRSLDLGETFDAALMMFAVLGYQLTNEDVLAALQTVRRHLNPDGLFICDVWYGPAVLTIRPSDRIKTLDDENGRILRIASGSLNTFKHLADVRYHVLHLMDKQVVEETEETHQMRYFFPQELDLFMKQAGLALFYMCDFNNLEKLPDESTWNVLVVAKNKEAT